MQVFAVNRDNGTDWIPSLNRAPSTGRLRHFLRARVSSTTVDALKVGISREFVCGFGCWS
jgi:hypothetical protein